MSDVTVVMSAYREDSGLFRQAVDSILAQTMPDLELLIALDDPGNEELRREAEGYAMRDPRVHVTVNETNLGLAASLNRAISLCSSKYVCRMDADDVALPDRIERQLAFIEEGGHDLVGGGLDVTDGAGELLYHAQRLPQSPEAVRRALRWNNCMPHPSWLGRRWVFEQGYRQIPLCEDYDLLIRTALAGGRMANVPGAVLRYRPRRRRGGGADMGRRAPGRRSLLALSQGKRPLQRGDGLSRGPSAVRASRPAPQDCPHVACLREQDVPPADGVSPVGASGAPARSARRGRRMPRPRRHSRRRGRLRRT